MSRRTVLLVSLALALISTLQVSCTVVPRSKPHRSLEALWDDFSAMPGKRALALAGDPNRQWVAGAAGGYPSEQEAGEVALAQCAERRRDKRIQKACRLYAVGNRIVW